MFLKLVVDGILMERNRSLSWLAAEMGKTFDGLRLSLIKGSIKYNDIQKMAEILDVHEAIFFSEPMDYTVEDRALILESTERYRNGFERDLRNCQEMLQALKSQLKDKERIIELLSK